MSASPATPETPTIPTDTPTRVDSKSQQNAETDSGKSSCSPALLDCSFDSGIGVEAAADLKLSKCIKQCKRILIALARDKEAYRILRDRLNKIVDKKNKGEEQFCNVCCAEIDLEDAKSFVTCCTCKKDICRGVKCADWLPNHGQWECQLCHSSKESLAQTSSWVAEQMSFNQQKFVYPMRARSEIYIPISDCNDSFIQFESVSQLGANSTDISADQKVKIREYVEEVVANMLGGSLENIAVGQLSKSLNYLPSIANGQGTTQSNSNSALNNNHNDFADVSQARLRQLIEGIIAETLRLPALSSTAVSEVALDTRSNGGESLSNGKSLSNGNGVTRRHRTEHYFEPKIYQDLLATAVLNKIVDQQSKARQLSESTPDLSADQMDANFNVENQSTTSGSSIEPRSECSTDTEQLLKELGGGEGDISTSSALLPAGRESVLSDYIAGHTVPLPDFSAPPTESEEDDYISVTSSTIGEGTWEDNWLFKKKRPSLQTSVTAGSVGMLVPAPKEDVRAQIGDKTTDEISDLSEMGSDTDDSSLDLLRTQLDPSNDRLLNKQLIGGHNTKMALDELIDSASMVSNSSPADNEPRITETKNELVVDTASKTEAINLNLASLQLPEAETGLLTPPSSFKDTKESVEIPNPNPLSGSIAEREYKKWNNAVEMPNNPYAPEALKRRISGSQERFMDLPNISPSTEQNPIELIQSIKDEAEADDQNRESDYKRYSRDYYINDAKQNTNSSKIPSSPDTNANSDEPAIDNITIHEPKNQPGASASPQTEHDIYQATPAQVVEESASIETVSNPSLQSETTIIHESIRMKASATMSAESACDASPPEVQSNIKERPTDLAFSGIPCTPSRGSTPTAFKFLQPKRKLIEPSQVLSFDEDVPQVTPTPPGEKGVIEEEVAQVLPSVKALAQAFLMTSSKSRLSHIERRWTAKVHKARTTNTPVTPTTPQPTPLPTPTSLGIKKLEASPSLAEIAEDVTITSDLSSLETDPSIYKEDETKDSADIPTATAVPSGFLKSNIAFFENLKFK